MNIAICDDDKGCCDIIKKWIKEIEKSETINISVDIFYSVESLLSDMEEGYCFDMIFLDIEFPEQSGIVLGHEINKKFGERNTGIIFISGKSIYCEELFELEPQNFHRKPLEKYMIENDIRKYVKRNKASSGILKYKKDGVPKGIAIGEIMYIEAVDKHLHIHTERGETIIINKKIQDISEKYKDLFLLRCHRSFIVNAKHIKKYSNSKFILYDETNIPIGRKYLTSVKDTWLRYEEE